MYSQSLPANMGNPQWPDMDVSYHRSNTAPSRHPRRQRTADLANDVVVFHTQNSDVTSWVEYLACSIKSEPRNTTVTFVEDIHFFPEITDNGQKYLDTSGTVIIVISPDLVSYLDDDPTYKFTHKLKDNMAAILFFCGVSEHCQTVHERFSDHNNWTKLVAECDQEHMDQVLNKICELIDNSSGKTHSGPSGPTLEPKSASLDEAAIERSKHSRRAVKNTRKCSLPHVTGSVLHSRPECRIIPENGPCNQETPVVLVFNERLQTHQELSVEFNGVDTLDHQVVMVEQLNPYTFQFNMPVHVCEDVRIKIKSNKDLLATKTFHYTSVLDKVSLITEVLLAMMDTMCKGHEEDEGFLSDLDLRIKSLFDSSDLPIKAFEQLFTFYESSTKVEKSTMEIPTLLHFVAKYGLKETAGVLNDLPGAKHVFSVLNTRGQDPMSLARQYSHPQLEDFLADWRETAEHEDMIYETMWKFSEMVEGSLTKEELSRPVKLQRAKSKGEYFTPVDDVSPSATWMPHYPSDLSVYDDMSDTLDNLTCTDPDNYDRPFKVPIPVDDEMYIQMDTAVSRDHVLPTQDSIDLEITAAQSETVTECDYLVMGGSAPAVVAAPPSPPPPRPSPPPPPRPSPPPPRPMEPHPNSRPKLNSQHKLERGEEIDLSMDDGSVEGGTSEIHESSDDPEVDPFPDLVEHGERPPPLSPAAMAEASQRELLEILHQVRDGKLSIPEAEACQQGWQLCYRNNRGGNSFKEKEENQKRLKENYKKVVDHIQTQEPSLSQQPEQKGIFEKIFRWNRGRNKAHMTKSQSVQAKTRAMSIDCQTLDLNRLQIAEDLTSRTEDPMLGDPVCISIPDLPDNILPILEDPPANNRYSTISNSSSSSVLNSDNETSNTESSSLVIGTGGGSFVSRASYVSAPDSGIDVPIREEGSPKHYASDDSVDAADTNSKSRKASLTSDVYNNPEKDEHEDNDHDGYESVDNWVDTKGSSVKARRGLSDGAIKPIEPADDGLPPPVPPRSPRRNSSAIPPPHKGSFHYPSGLPRPRAASQPFIQPLTKSQPKPLPSAPKQSGIPKAPGSGPVRKMVAKNYSNVVVSLKHNVNFQDRKKRGASSGFAESVTEVAIGVEHERKSSLTAPPVPPRSHRNSPQLK